MTKPLPPTWAEVIPLWLDALRGADLAESTLKLREYQLRRFVTEHATVTPESVTLDDLSSWLSRDGWSASTKHSARSAVRSFFEWMEYTERREDNPARWLRKVRVPLGKPRPAGELTVRRAWQHDDPRVRLMAKLASIEGLRAVEICRVHTDDVFEDLIGFSLRVLGKGRRVRVIPLDDQLATELLEYPRGFIFPGKIEGHLSAPYVSKLLSRALPDGVTGHMLRHRAAGRVYEGSGRDLRATQEFLGHASVATTQIYTPASNDQMRLGLLAAAG